MSPNPGTEMADEQAVKAARSKRGRGRPTTHGMTVMRRALAKLGTAKLDQRSAVAIAARRFKADLVRDLGGDVSRQQATIIELAARTWIMLEALDDWLMRQPTLVNQRRKAVLPVVMQRQALADALARNMVQLGLTRKAAPVESLHDYVRRRDATIASNTSGNGATASPAAA